MTRVLPCAVEKSTFDTLRFVRVALFMIIVFVVRLEVVRLFPLMVEPRKVDEIDNELHEMVLP